MARTSRKIASVKFVLLYVMSECFVHKICMIDLLQIVHCKSSIMLSLTCYFFTETICQIYDEEPPTVEPSSTTYPNFTRLWLSPGLKRAGLINRRLTGDLSSRTDSKHGRGTSRAYSVEIRRACKWCTE